MKLGILSDSHDHLDHMARAARLFRAAGVEMVVHAGDIGSPAAIKALAGFPLVGVFGNNDGERAGLRAMARRQNGRIEAEFLQVDLGGFKAAIYHGTTPQITDALIRCGTYGLVIYGHTHKVVEKMVGETWVLNPGTAHGFDGRATALVVDTVTRRVEALLLRGEGNA